MLERAPGVTLVAAGGRASVTKHETFHGLILAVAVSLVLFAPVSPAQQSDTGGDETCDDEIVGGPVLTCDVTKVTIDFDGPSATFWGTFCENPTVTAGQLDGTHLPVLVLIAAAGFVTVDLTGNDNPADVFFRITCPCSTCTCELTIGGVGPPGN